MIKALRPLLPLLCVLAACGDADQTRLRVAADTGGTAVVAMPADFDFANILLTGDRYTQEMLRFALFLPLVQYDSALGYQPALAESFQIEGDTAVQFKLRRDVFWHDGQHTTAYDVAFTFERATDTATAFPNLDWLAGWGRPVVLDSFTVRFALQHMADPLAGVALLPIMPRHLLEATPAARMREAAFNKKPVGNGPFKFVEYQANDRWVLEANRQHPESLGGRPNLSRVVFRIIPDPLAQIAELKAGNVDFALLVPTDQFKALDADPQLVGITRDSRNYAFIAWNAKRAGLSDPRVRRALTMALDRRTMIGLARAGVGEISDSPVGAYSWAYDPTLQPLPYNPDSARALLTVAGWGNGRLALRLKHPANSAAMKTVSELVRADLAKVGVAVIVEPIEGGTLFEQITAPDRNFDAVLLGWENDIRLNYRDMYHSAELSNPFQFASYSNPEVDRIIDQASAEPDRAKALPMWKRFQAIMREEVPWTILFHFKDLYVVRERLQGVRADLRGALVSMPDWSIQRDSAQ